jgi:hypothetical protein
MAMMRQVVYKLLQGNTKQDNWALLCIFTSSPYLSLKDSYLILEAEMSLSD